MSTETFIKSNETHHRDLHKRLAVLLWDQIRSQWLRHGKYVKRAVDKSKETLERDLHKTLAQ